MDSKRRNFIKMLAVGGVAFFAGKFIGPLFSYVSDSSGKSFGKLLMGGEYSGSKIIESADSYTFLDSSNEQVLIIDKDAFKN